METVYFVGTIAFVVVLACYIIGKLARWAGFTDVECHHCHRMFPPDRHDAHEAVCRAGEVFHSKLRDPEVFAINGEK